jgi:hypothetical protein
MIVVSVSGGGFVTEHRDCGGLLSRADEVNVLKAKQNSKGWKENRRRSLMQIMNASSRSWFESGCVLAAGHLRIRVALRQTEATQTRKAVMRARA